MIYTSSVQRLIIFFFFQAEDGIRDYKVTGVQTCALPISSGREGADFVPGLDDPVPARAVPFVEAMVVRRVAGEPLQYVVGRWGFRRLEIGRASCRERV